MTQELKEIGLHVGHRRVGRLMHDNGFRVVRTHRYKEKTDSNYRFKIALFEYINDFYNPRR